MRSSADSSPCRDSPASRRTSYRRSLSAAAVILLSACSARLPAPVAGVDPPPIVQLGGDGSSRLIVVGDFGDGASTVFAGVARVHREHPADAVLTE